ncbi:Elongation factor G, mitochondrial [Clarias magur]|uniref:Elongation factor G, mitochondrial n=1 Tax=Clarias magur TaxID=1594786 RepID=A0A8J4T4H6_CLAMG|nr:Elongation factor G, mitochondrial [Clarias magur]
MLAATSPFNGTHLGSKLTSRCCSSAAVRRPTLPPPRRKESSGHESPLLPARDGGCTLGPRKKRLLERGPPHFIPYPPQKPPTDEPMPFEPMHSHEGSCR